MGESSPSSEAFESIDLMQSALRPVSNASRPYQEVSRGLSLNVPASDSATDYEDDYSDHDFTNDFTTFRSRDDDFDPEELILSQSPPKSALRDPFHSELSHSASATAHLEEPTLTMRKRFDLKAEALAQSDVSETTAGLSASSSGLLRSSIMNDGVPFYSRVVEAVHSNTDQKSPLHYVTEKGIVLMRELNSNIARQKELLEHGHPDLDKVRSMIGQDFSLLSENYISQHELLSKQYLETTETLNGLREFETKNVKLLEKIALIKSPGHGHGSKLAQLLYHDERLDSEIMSLEQQIESLKENKRVIKSEIDTTASVLESKASKYITKFKVRELQGRKAVEQILLAHGVPPDQLDSVMHTEAVNITFNDAYRSQRANHTNKSDTHDIPRRSNRSDLHTAPPEQSSASYLKSGHTESKIRATSPHSEPVHHSDPNRPDIIPSPRDSGVADRESYNHGHGPSPYERGFEYGSKLSVRVRQRMSEILKQMWSSINSHVDHQKVIAGTNANVLVDEDEQNSISSRLNITPIIALLRQKAEAYESLARDCANQSAQCHELAKVWQDANRYLINQENKMAAYVASILLLPPSTENATWIMNNLHATAEKLRSLADVSIIVTSSESGEITTFLKQALANESHAIAAATEVAVSHFSTGYKEVTGA